jgi:hypothetical protein
MGNLIEPKSPLQLKAFLTELRNESDRLHLKYINDDKFKLVRIFNRLIPLRTLQVREENETASKFNVFKILRYGNYETRLHTPFLCHLLNVKGHHQFGHSFFNKFILQIFPIADLKLIEDIEVIEEFTIGAETEDSSGRIDILIKFRVADERYCFAIENKINAKDQRDQLKRYLDYINEQNPKGVNKVIYLTKYGEFPDPKTYSELSDYSSIINGDQYVMLSHKYQIKQIIEDLIKESIPSRVKETLVQYRQILNQF